jgi:DNA-binding NtrC family response regulator
MVKKILVVDDEQDIRKMAKGCLEDEGYEVILAVDGDECLKILKTKKPDLILLDILMPGPKVEDVIEQINNIKIIMFTVITAQEKLHLARHPKVIDYIEKPFDLPILIGKVKKALGDKND